MPFYKDTVCIRYGKVAVCTMTAEITVLPNEMRKMNWDHEGQKLFQHGNLRRDCFEKQNTFTQLKTRFASARKKPSSSGIPLMRISFPIFRIPLYYEAKLAFVIYLWYPKTEVTYNSIPPHHGCQASQYSKKRYMNFIAHHRQYIVCFCQFQPGYLLLGEGDIRVRVWIR